MTRRTLPTLAELQRTPRATPKGQTKLEAKIEAMREEARAGIAFRAAVWKRDDHKCRICHRKVIRSISLRPERGEVHHVKGRNVTPEDRYNVNAAILCCSLCHIKLQRHEIEVPKP